MANTLRFKRGLLAGLPSAAVGEPLFTTDTFDLYIGTASGTQKYQKFIASGTTSQLLRGDGSLLTMPIVLSSPANGEVLKYNGTNWVNSSDAGITGSLTTNYIPKATSATTLGNSLIYDSGSFVGINTVSSTPANANASIFYGSTDSGIIYLMRTTGTDQLRFYTAGNRLGYINTASNILTLGTANYPLVFSTNDTERARITSGGNFIINNASTDNGLRFQVTGDGYFSGSVGIGVSPAAKLDILATASDDIIALRYPTLGKVAGVYLDSANVYYGAGANNFTNAFVAGHTTNVLTLRTAGTVRATLDASGNLGVGTTTPSGLFHVSGNGVSYFTRATKDLIINPNVVGANTHALIDVTSGMAIAFGSIGGSERMRIDASGNLGLGVTPSAWSSASRSSMQIGNIIGGGHLSSGSGYTSLGGNSYFDGTNWKFVANGYGPQLFINASNGSFGFSTSNSGTAGGNITYTQAMTLDASGRLLVGTTTAGETLTIYNASGGAALFQNSTTGTGASNGLYVGNAAGLGYLWNYNNFAILFGTNNTERMRLFSDGNFGIGTGSTNAGYKLDVNGTMRVSGASLFSTSLCVFGLNLTSTYASKFGVYNSSSAANMELGTLSATNGSIVSRITSYNVSNGNSGNESSTNFMGIVSLETQFQGTNGGNFILKTKGDGGTLDTRLTVASTGAATFSSSVTGASFIPTSSTIPTNGMYLSAANTLDFATNTTNRLSISSTGAATFSSSVKATRFQLTNSSGEYYYFDNASGNNFIGLYAVNTLGLYVGGNLSLSVASTGAATFSSSVTAASLLMTKGSLTNDTGFGTGFNVLGNTTTYIGSTGGIVGFVASNAEGMRLTSTGLGIGMTPSYKLDVTGQARVSDAIAIGTTPDTNLPFKILKNINSTVGIRFENTSTGNVAYSAVQFGTDVTGGTKFANLVYSSSGITESGAYKQNGTSIINTGTGGLNLLAVDGTIRFFTSSSNGTLRAEIANDGFINHYTGTAPSTNLTDGYRQYSADITAGNAAPHFRTENGGIIKLYQQTTGVTSATYIGGAGTGLTDSDTFDGYTIAQIVKALRNAGLLA